MTATALVFVLSTMGAVDHRVPVELDATTYVSTSKRYELFIEPSERSGRGQGLHVLREHGKEVWRRELPVTLWEAVVADTGVVAGYAYSEGLDGWRDDAGTLQVFVLEPNGDERCRAAIEREDDGPRPFHDGFAAGLVLDEEHDRFILRIDGHWWIYRLSDGAKLAEQRPMEHVQPTEEQRIWMGEVHPIGGIPLLLVRYWSLDGTDYSMGYHREGAVYTLVGLDGRPVWTLALPHDYTIENDKVADAELRRKVQRTGAILATGERSFSLWHVADRQRVDYRVEATSDGSGWVALEVGRSPFEPAPRVAVSRIELRSLGSVRLRDVKVDRGAIRDIAAFEPQDDDSIAFVRSEADGGFSAVWIDREGRLLAERSLAPFEKGSREWRHWLLPRAGPWLSFQGSTPNHVRVWRVFPGDGRTELASEVFCPVCLNVGDLSARGDGGFVALGWRSDDVNGGDSLRSFAPDGEVQWKHTNGQGYTQEDLDDLSILFSPEAVHVLDDGRVAVVDVIRHTIQLWLPDGSFSHALELTKVLGREPNYPHELSWDRDDGLLLEDSGQPRFYRFGVDGSLRGSFDALHEDGSEVPDVCVAPDGSLWGSDGQFFYALDDSGRVVRALGERMSEQTLHSPVIVGVDPGGLIHVQDASTGAIHVFDSTGERVRLESADLGAESVALQPPSDRRWEHSDDELTLRAPDARIVVRHAKRPGDRRWLRIDDCAAGPDGTAAVLSEGVGYGSRRELEPGLALFSPDGAPLRTVRLQEDMVSTVEFNGRWAALCRWDPVVYLVDLDDDSIRRFVCGEDVPRHSWYPFFSPDDRELWMVERGERDVRLHRYALPE